MAAEPEDVPRERDRQDCGQGGLGSSGGYGDSAWYLWPSRPPPDPGGLAPARAGDAGEPTSGEGSAEGSRRRGWLGDAAWGPSWHRCSVAEWSLGDWSGRKA
eukprot:4512345-Alexandrium_andersonii.AAC.1